MEFLLADVNSLVRHSVATMMVSACGWAFWRGGAECRAWPLVGGDSDPGRCPGLSYFAPIGAGGARLGRWVRGREPKAKLCRPDWGWGVGILMGSLFLEDEKFAADEVDHGRGDDEGEVGDIVGDVEGVDEPDGEEFANGKADEGDDGEEGELFLGAVPTRGEDEPAVEGVGREIRRKEGDEVEIDEVFPALAFGEIGGEVIGIEMLTSLGDDEKDDDGEDAAGAILPELNQEGGVAGEESLLHSLLPEEFPGAGDFAGDHAEGKMESMESMASIRARTAFWAWSRFSACWKMVSEWASRTFSVISLPR